MEVDLVSCDTWWLWGLGSAIFFLLGCFALWTWPRRGRKSIKRSSAPAASMRPSRSTDDLKPCSPDTTKASPTQTPQSTVVALDCQTHTLPNPERDVTEVDAVIIDLLREAPELPSAALELSQLLRDPDVHARQVAEIVSTDPVLSAQILRVANSAFVGLGKIVSVQKAVLLLGFNQIWILVNQMLMSRSFDDIAIRLPPERMKTLWRHAAATVTCAFHVLQAVGLNNSPKAGVVLTCALLHDVGKFFLNTLESQNPTEEKTVEGSKPSDLPPILLELHDYGIDHARMGYLLTTNWRLPEEVCTTVGYHHHGAFSNWEAVPEHVREIVLLVGWSDYLANMLGYHESIAVAYRPPIERLLELGWRREPDTLLTAGLERDLRTIERLVNGDLRA